MISKKIISAMIKDEKEASRYYCNLARKETDPETKRRLQEISKQEGEHLQFWLNLRGN